MRPETLKGHLDGMLLAALEPGPRHGYAIMEALRVCSGGQFDLPTGTVYPALHRLERQGWVRSEWKQTESNQRARYYRITAAGKKQMACDLSRWQHMVEVIGAVMHRAPEGDEA